MLSGAVEIFSSFRKDTFAADGIRQRGVTEAHTKSLCNFRVPKPFSPQSAELPTSDFLGLYRHLITSQLAFGSDDNYGKFGLNNKFHD